MALTAPTTDQLATFSRTDAADVSPDAPELLSQARLLFYMATGLTEDPTEVDDLQIAINGMCAMAEYLLSEDPDTRATAAAGIRSENIGSYSYQLFKNIQAGLPTGVMWFDQAVAHLRPDGITLTTTRVFEGADGLLFVSTEGNGLILGPADVAGSTAQPHDPSRPDALP